MAMRSLGIAVLLLAALATAVSASPAEALERGIVYSKTLEPTPSEEAEGAPLKGGLYVLRGKRPHRLTFDPGDVEPNVARDGTIAFVRNGDLYLVGPDGSGLRQLTTGPEIDERPLFSPDGRSLVFTRRAAPSDPRDLYLIDRDGTSPRPLTATPEDELEAAFSLDGATVVFARRLPVKAAGANGDLFSVRHDGSGLRQLTRTAVQEFSPHYFVGGIVFNRRRAMNEGAADIYAMRRDGTKARPLVAKKPGTRIDAVSANGRLLVFSARWLWVKRLAAGRSFPARKLNPFGPSPMVLSPDNRFVAFLFYFDEQLSLSTVDLRTGEFGIEGEVYNYGGEGGIDPRIAW